MRPAGARGPRTGPAAGLHPSMTPPGPVPRQGLWTLLAGSVRLIGPPRRAVSEKPRRHPVFPPPPGQRNGTCPGAGRPRRRHGQLGQVPQHGRRGARARDVQRRVAVTVHHEHPAVPEFRRRRGPWAKIPANFRFGSPAARHTSARQPRGPRISGPVPAAARPRRRPARPPAPVPGPVSRWRSRRGRACRRGSCGIGGSAPVRAVRVRAGGCGRGCAAGGGQQESGEEGPLHAPSSARTASV